jgi:outer membrane protein assembly factor BamD (BamD/ComL family)
LADENALIDAARKALGERHAADAAAFLDQHARSHPNGQMAEEREALWVQALVAQGAGEAARARAARFRERFPQSIQLDVISAALETIP